VAVLTLATWLTGGYSFGEWPQLFPLEHILRLNGTLQGDWYTSHAAPHWVFDHALALLPVGWLGPAFALLWVAGLALFWSAFAALAGDLGVPEAGIVAAGLIGVRTSFAGFGLVTLLTTSLYPSSLACAAWLFALREALRGRALAAAGWTGAVLLIHPQAGVLALLTTVPVVARLAGPGRALRYAAVALLSGGFALARLVADLALNEPLSASERFDLLARVRLPHHLLYRAFRPEDYAAVALWALALAMALPRLRAAGAPIAERIAGWNVLLGAFALLVMAGAAASSLGRPLALVELQTARVSAWVPLLGVLAAAAALTCGRPATGALALFAVPVLAGLLAPLVRPALARAGFAALPWHALQAPVLIALMIAAPAARAPGPWWMLWRRRPASAVPASGLRGVRAIGAAVALVALALPATGWRGVPRMHGGADWRAIAAEAGRRSQPTDIVLTPPDLDGFSFFSHRPIVVNFGEVAHDDLAGWRERMEAVTGNAGLLSPDLGIGAEARSARIASAYDSTVGHAPELVRRYGVKFVVARRAALPDAPVWADPVATNATYVLLKVRREILE
jgi:hypothetical protein